MPSLLSGPRRVSRALLLVDGVWPARYRERAPSHTRVTHMAATAVRDLVAERFYFLRYCPDWILRWVSTSEVWEARSPSYASDGRAVQAKDVRDLVTLVKTVSR